MELHQCRPPMERRPVADSRAWDCSDCGRTWEVYPLGPMDPAPAYDFTTGEGVVNAKWVPAGTDDPEGCSPSAG